jgi:hypothetical protein
MAGAHVLEQRLDPGTAPPEEQQLIHLTPQRREQAAASRAVGRKPIKARAQLSEVRAGRARRTGVG